MTLVTEPHVDHHVVQFYENDSELVARAGGYLSLGLEAGEAAIVIATPEHRDAFAAHVRGAAGEPVWLDAAELLAQLMRHGRVDREAFFASVGSVVRAAAATGRPVRAYGEMVALLWEAGDVTSAIELETLWNELATHVPFSLYCAYRSESVAGHEHADALERVCRLHSAVVPSLPAQTTWRFPADPDALADARHLVGEALERMGYEGEPLDNARLIITELAANAVVHARSAFSVTLRDGGATVRILVRDRSPAAPAMRVESSSALGGRGLRLVSALAHRWGVEPAPDGKVVWAELTR